MNFTYCNPAKIVFGKGCESEVGKEIARYGTRVLIVLGGPFVKECGLFGKISRSLDAQSITYVDFDRVVPNPRLEHVLEGVEVCKNNRLDFVLAVGGGSAIDTAKAIAAGVKCREPLWDYFMDFSKYVQEALPTGVILTLPATGSESSSCAVITNGSTGLKRSIFSDGIIPKFAMLNPEMSYTLPPYQTACGSADILAHLMEMYFTNVPNVDLTDRLLEGAMKTVVHFAPLALEFPRDYDVRAELYWAANVTNNGILQSGRIGDWASHNIEHEISGIYDIAHGAGLSIAFPAWMKYVWKRNPKKFVQFAERVFDVRFAEGEDERAAREGIQRLESFFTRLGLPTRLSQAGIGAERIREMADKAMVGRGSLGMLVPLKADDIHEILRLAI